MFIDRESELGVLKGAVRSGRSELVVVYGRRRVGKTFLLREFQRVCGGVYLSVNYGDRALALQDLSRQLREGLGIELGRFDTFRELYKAALTFAERLRGAPIMMIDEAQRLAGTGGLSELQYLWDTELSGAECVVVLSGSGVGMVERVLLSYESPIYGRVTKVLHLTPFSYRVARAFMRGWGPKDRVRGYAVFGGMPAYLSLIDDGEPLSTNILKSILNPASIMHHDPHYLLAMETREPQRYLGIMEAVARGRRRAGEIASYLGLPVNVVSKYLYVLENALGLIVKEYPLGFEGKKRYGLYDITDNYFRFWLREIYPRLGDPSLSTEHYLRKVMKRIEDDYASRAWEQIAREHMNLLLHEGKVSYARAGKWWYRGEEIDLVAINEEEKTAYFIECKWSEKTPVRKHVERLKKKASRTPWRDWRHEYIIYTAGNEVVEGEDVKTYTLEDVENLMEKYTPRISTTELLNSP